MSGGEGRPLLTPLGCGSIRAVLVMWELSYRVIKVRMDMTLSAERVVD